MDIQIGDRITYKNETTEIVMNNSYRDYINKIHDEILKIERPKYEVIEEKKELLTEEEKEFLKNYMKFIGFEKDIEYIEKFDNHIIALYLSDNSDFRFEITSGENFINLEDYKKYTLEELGLK